MNTTPNSTWSTQDRKENQVKRLANDFVSDQKDIWTSPSHLRLSDTIWLVPVSGITAGLFVTDASYSHSLTRNPSTISRNNNLSNAGVAALVGGAGSMWLLSYKTHNEHWRETGLLAGQAAINSLVTIEAMKYSFGRQRPNQGYGDGNFFSGGSSFPSEHAAAAFAVAGVIAHEYPGPLTKLLAYGAATAVMYGRVHSLNHFRSDVFVGSLIGNLAAAQVYRKRHDPELGGDAFETMSDISREAARGSSRANLGSPYVPLDSWVYPIFNRLIALGYIRTAIQGTQPWTRFECVRLLDEAEDHQAKSGKDDPQISADLHALFGEFARDMELGSGKPNEYVTVDSVYARATGISGRPLTDGYFFGQTISNDYGRPYQEGFNSILGFSGWAAQGPLVAYVQAEYQHVPFAPPLPESARNYMYNTSVALPNVPPATPFSEINKMQFVDAYVGMTFANWELSYGKQSLWWGFNQGGPLMFSDNSSPVNMFRINRVSPFTLPYVFNLLGPMKLEFILGQLSGHEFVYRTDTGFVGEYGQGVARQPFIQGQKFSFKPTDVFEFGVYFDVLFSGGPTPLTPYYFFHSYSINGGAIHLGGATTDPGDRRSGVNWSYRIPGLRNWVTFYGDAFTEDEFSPLGYPRKSAYQAGLYLARIPWVQKLDLRIEGGSTVPPDFPGCNGCFYVNTRYPNGYTNSGNLMGSTLGRGSQGEHAWSTYWFSPRNKLQFSYSHQKLSSWLFPGGGTINTAGVQAVLQPRPDISLTGSMQYEKWNIPVLNPTVQSDWTTTIGVTYWPRNWNAQMRF